jgi:hypothetical protein
MATRRLSRSWRGGSALASSRWGGYLRRSDARVLRIREIALRGMDG